MLTTNPFSFNFLFYSGITKKADYLSELGVGAIWISPIYKSPMADFGYDVSDYKDIDPIFGTIEHMEDLIAEMHSRGKILSGICAMTFKLGHSPFLPLLSS